jgi:cyanate permease
MSGAIPLLPLYAFVAWTVTTLMLKRKVGCSLHMLRNMIYTFCVTFVRFILGEVSLYVGTSAVFLYA